jgi:hypothetical protein
MRDFARLLPLVVAGAALLVLTSSPSAAQSAGPQAEANLIGVWQLDLAKSKYSPGPAPVRETRTYTRDEKGTVGRIERQYDDGRKDVIDYRVEFDRDHLVSGSLTYDTVRLRRVDPLTVDAVLSHAGRVWGTARRVVSQDGETMTVTFRRTEPGDMINNVAVYRKARR